MKNALKKHLSEHFILFEFTRSGTAIDNDIDNTPGERETAALTALCCHILEPLRQWAREPIVISSGFRTRRLNKLVGGVSNSQHCLGEAADIVIGNPGRGRKLYDYIRRHLDFDQLILEPIGSDSPRWIHVSYTRKRKNRRMIVG